jgi:hypothetical protein
VTTPWALWIAAAGALVWLVATWRLRRGSALVAAHTEVGLGAVLEHAAAVPAAQSLEDAFQHVQRAAQAAFGSSHAALVYLGEDRTLCRCIDRKGRPRELPARFWTALLHAPWQGNLLAPAGLDDAVSPLVAMPLRALGEWLHADLLVAWVDRGRLICVTALALGRPVNDHDTALIEVWNNSLVHACANYVIARHVGYQQELIREVEQARAIIDSLPSRASAGSIGSLSWQVHEPPRVQPESTFWEVYELSQGRLLLIAGEIIADGLAAAMMSIAVRSCCDTLFHLVGDDIEPYNLLDGLNRYLWREINPVGMSCVVVLFDPARRRIEHATAGTMTLWRMQWRGEHAEVELCSEPGPLVGSGPQADYLVERGPLGPGDAFVMMSQRAARAIWDVLEPLPRFPDSRFDVDDGTSARALCQHVARASAGATADAPVIVVRVRGDGAPSG